MIKKGQLRRWKEGWGWWHGKTFLTIGCKTIYGEVRNDLGWGGRHRGRKVWTILQDGCLEYEDHMEIERGSEAIDEAG
jgi:hypothetical protein